MEIPFVLSTLRLRSYRIPHLCIKKTLLRTLAVRYSNRVLSRVLGVISQRATLTLYYLHVDERLLGSMNFVDIVRAPSMELGNP